MPYTLRAPLAALCLSLILPCIQPAMAADPAPAKEPAATEPVVERAPLLSRSKEDAQALERQLPLQEQQQLQAGDETFLALWKPANSSDPKGAVIIIPGADESADWPDAVGPLRRKFPDVGWASLSLTLPDMLGDTPLARAPEETPAPAPADAADPKPKDAAASDATKAVDATAKAEAEAAATAAQAAAAEERAKADADRIFARIQAAITFAQQNKARSIVLVGHGSGAYWAARFLSEKPSPLIQKLVLVAAQEPANARPQLMDLTQTLKVATGDFVYKDRPQARKAAQQRLDASKRGKGAGFTQVTLTAIPGNEAGQQDQLFRRVRGWLEAR